MVIAEQRASTLRALVRAISGSLAGEHLSVSDMSRAGALEFDPSIAHGQPGHGQGAAASDIRRLEGRIRAMPVPRHTGQSPIRYFLDGSQRTLPVWRVGTTPVIVSATAVAILQRHGPSEISIVPETLVARLHWIVPRYTGNPTLNRIVALLEGMGQWVVDPLEREHQSDPNGYQHLASDYICVLERAYEAANSERGRVEGMLLYEWQNTTSRQDPTGWIVVDGPLNTNTQNAIGLVKNARAQHFEGAEAAVLYDLSPGQRTGAYSLASSDHREGAERALWYLRMQDATGLDARHGLIRLEAAEVLADSDLIDPISSWILAERAPRASTDDRWATLLYPIHLLERMLKRRIDTLTAGWPS